MKAIVNATLVLHEYYLPEAVLFIEDGKIAGFGEMRSCPVPKDYIISSLWRRYTVSSP